MKVTCSRTNLRDALRMAEGVVDPRTPKDVLKNVHVRAAGDCMEITATDLEVGIKCIVRDAEVKKEGGILIPVAKVSSLLSESRAEKLSLEVGEGKLVIKAKGSRFNVLGASDEEFPEIPAFPEDGVLEIEGSILKEMIEKTTFAVAMEKDRYALNGVLIVMKEKSPKVEMVATDGRRLAIIRRKANAPSPFAASVIVPVKALQLVLKMIGDEEIVKISVQERQALFRGENATLVAQLVEGRFPPYEEVIPSDCDKKLEADTDELVNAVRQAAILTARETRAVKLQLDSKSGIVESSDPEAGEAHVEIDVQYTGDPIEVRFNPEFLLDGIKAVALDRVRIEMKDRSRAALMKSGADYLYLLMPISQD